MNKCENKRCGLLFESANQLRQHQVLFECKCTRKTKKSSLKNREKQPSIDEVIATKQKEVRVKKVNLSEDSEEETDAEEEKCMICKNTFIHRDNMYTMYYRNKCLNVKDQMLFWVHTVYVQIDI